MSWLESTWVLLQKDLRIEMRNRVAVNGLLMFVLGAIMLLVLGLRTVSISSSMTSSLYWLIILLSGSVGLFHTFASEEESFTANLLRLSTSPGAVLASKLLYNFVMVGFACLVTTICFVVFVRMQVDSWTALCTVAVLGCSGLAGAASILGAIVARAKASAIVLPVLLFPLLLPLLWLATDATLASIEPAAARADLPGSITGLVAYVGLVVTAAALLIDKIWLD